MQYSYTLKTRYPKLFVGKVSVDFHIILSHIITLVVHLDKAPVEGALLQVVDLAVGLHRVQTHRSILHNQTSVFPFRKNHEKK